jgi:Family of unknown function (DUF5317)
MFILYAVIAGIVVGLVFGGRLAGLTAIDLRWRSVAIGGFLVQVVLFSTPLTDRIGALGPIIYVLSTGVVLLAVLRNAGIPGMSVVALGAASNLAAIVANGGFMPADPGALAGLGHALPTGYTNSTVLAVPNLQPLTDVWVLPSWLPFRNVFSIGDVLIAVGIGAVIVLAMRAGRGGASGKLPRTVGPIGTPGP